MRLSTADDRDEARAIEVLHAALDAGVRLLDTADAYAWDDTEAGHNERLIARALSTWSGDGGGVTVATKGGLTRPGGRWVPDGRAGHLRRACEASLAALGVDRIDLYQLHAVDPRVRLSTSVRALRRLRDEGLVERVGLCNVDLSQLRQARSLCPIDAVQVSLSPFDDAPLRNGVAAECERLGIALLAHTPLGGPRRARALRGHAGLAAVAERRARTPGDVALAWLRALGPRVTPLPGVSRVETARAAGGSGALGLDERDRATLARSLPMGPRIRRASPAGADGEIVLVMGRPGSGKSSVARAFVDRGHERLNRDDLGGTLRDLLPRLDAGLAEGRRRWVLDNTYPTRAARDEVLELAGRHGVPVRCVHLDTREEDAQVNVVRRMIERYGRVIGPEERRAMSKRHPDVFGPTALLSYRRAFEAPTLEEGFAAVETLAFERRPAEGEGRAIFVEYDGVLRSSRRGDRSPRSPDDVVARADRGARLADHAARGVALVGLAWLPELSGGELDEAAARAILARTHDALGVALDPRWCPHAAGPPVCWCRRPLPALGVAEIVARGLDPARCLVVGRGPADRGFAARCGFAFAEHDDWFAAGAPFFDS